MKFENISDKTRMVKINNVWKDVKPGEVIDTPIGVRITSDYFEMEDNKNQMEDNLIPEEKPDDEEEESILTESQLNKMTKDEINDYASDKGWDYITSGWRKSKMIKEVLELQNESE